MPAFSAKYDIAQYGYVIIEFYELVAPRTGRRRADSRFISGDAVNANIEKTAYDCTEYKHKYRNQVVHLFLYITLFA
jgi:hypothetical protein